MLHRHTPLLLPQHAAPGRTVADYDSAARQTGLKDDDFGLYAHYSKQPQSAMPPTTHMMVHCILHLDTKHSCRVLGIDNGLCSSK